ncbi:MAG: YadA-like family protein [Neisseria sp.]|uniref:YadA-like family protein n=1 Tax=Neisseria sp. TaxID=192066 RepID=UPI0026DBA02B|nr:YadA-like family protein [Neisseria sp.]MDO4641751.1 YadA-like family protein [Neisseria sp.]
MNKSYRTIWNDALEAWVAVSEIESAKGKPSSSRKTAAHSSTKIFSWNAVALSLMMALGMTVSVSANAANGNLVCTWEGTATANTTTGQPRTGAHNMVCGYGAVASTDQSVAIGPNSNASGKQSIAIGGDTKATGDNSIAIGGDDLRAVAGATNTTEAARKYNELTGDNLYKGYSGTATKSGAVAVGISSTSDDLATAFGTRAVASGVASVALGVGATASKENAVAIGAGSTTAVDATAPQSVTINGVTFNFSGGSTLVAGDQVSFGAAGFERQLKNVAPGVVSESSTDAINGSQLYSVAKELVRVGHSVTTLEDTKVHFYSVNNKTTTEGNYNNDGATGANALAAGVNVTAAGTNAVAVGNSAQAAAASTIAIGDKAVIGTTVGDSTGAITVGLSSSADGKAAVAIGNEAVANKNHTLALGVKAQSTADGAVAVGQNSGASGTNAIAIGSLSKASASAASAFGAGANAAGAVSTAIGNDTLAGANATAVGHAAKATGTSSAAFGEGANASGGVSTALGTSARASGDGALAAGNGANASGWRATALGIESSANGSQALAVGDKSQAGGSRSVSVGNQSKASGEYAIATGYDANAKSEETIAIGHSSVAEERAGVAIGNASKSLRREAVAVGYEAQAYQVQSVAIGSNAQAKGDQSTALGNNVVSLGDSSIAIGGDDLNTVANDNQSTTAIAYHRLTGEQLVDYTSHETQYISTVSGHASVAIGVAAQASGTLSTGLGTKAKATADISTALGVGATATKENAVALGAGSKTEKGATTETSATINGITYGNFAGAGDVSDGDLISVGHTGFERQIKHVAPGAVTAESTDAINGSQLYSVTNQLQNKLTHYYSVNDNGVQGGNYNNDGATGLNAMAAGIGATASGERATAFGSDAAASGENSTVVGYKAAASGRHSVAFGYASGAAGDYSLVLGDEASASKTNTIAVGSHANASSEYAQAIGINAVASGVSSVALGNTAKAAASEAVALGHLSNASAANTTAIGYGAATAGEQSTALGANSRAVNFKDVALGAESVSEAAVGTSSATVNGINYGGFAGNSPTANVSVGSSTVKRTVTNVAAGRIEAGSTDAINGSQLYQTQNVIGNVAGSTKNILGGNAALDSSGNLSMSNIGGTNQDTVDEAIKHVNKGWKAAVTNTSNGEASPLAESDQIQPDETLTFEADKNIKLTQATGKITVATKDDVSFNSVNSTTVTAGNGDNQVILGNEGVKVGGNTYINNGGLNANDKKITNVADGVVSETSTDAVNGKQLFEVQNGGWNLKGNGSQKDVVKQNDAVDFVNGTGTTAAVETAADGVSSTVKFSVNKSTLSVGSDGTVEAGTSGDNFATAEDVATAINSAAKSTVVEAGNNTSVNSSVNGKTTTYTVNAEKTTVSGTGDVKVTAGAKDAKDVTNYAVDLTDEAKAKIEKGSQAKDKVDTEGLTFTADNNTTTGIKKLGESLSVTGDSNITTAATADGIQVKLNPELNVTSVTAGDSKLVSDGLTISNGAANNPVSLTKAGLDNGGNKIANVADGENPKDAVNKSQLDAVKTLAETGWKVQANDTEAEKVGLGDTVKFTDGTNIKITQNGKNLTVATTDTLKADSFTVNGNGPVLSGSGLNNAGNKITGVADGTVEANSKDAINGGQLNAQGEGVKNIIGGDTVYNPTDGSFTNNNIGGTGKSTIDEAIKAANVTANAGWNLTAQGENKSNVAPNDTVDLNNTDKNIVISKTTDSDNVTFNLAKDLNVDSITAGDSKLNTEGLTISNGAAGNPVKLTKSGLDNGGNKITNVAAGTVAADSTDAVNGSQLFNTADSIKTVLGGNATVTPEGKVTTSNIGGTGANTVEEAVAHLNKGWKAAITATADGEQVTPISGGDQIQPDETLTYEAGKNIKLTQETGKIAIATKDDVNFNSVTSATVTAGSGDNQVVLDSEGVKVGGNTYISGSGLNANDKVISNVAAGKTDKDAVNVSQLTPLAKALGTQVDPATGTISAPTFVVTKADGSKYDGANTIQGALDNIGTEIQKPITFGGDSGNEFTRKLGTKVNVKGGADETKLSDNNIGVVSDGTDTLNVKLSKELTDLTSAQFKDAAGHTTTVNGAGITIENGAAGQPVSLTTNGLDNGGNKVTNVADGAADTDAVNKRQLDAATASARNKVAAGKNIEVAEQKNNDGSTTYTVATKDEVQFTKATLGDTVIDGTTGDITGLKNKTLGGNDFAAAGRAATEEQLDAAQSNLANILGGNATNTGGNVSVSDIGGTGKSTIDEAIRAANTTANAGWNLTAQGQNSSNVAPNDTVDLNNTDKNIVISKTADSDNVTFNLAKDLKVDSITAGSGDNQVVLGNDGVTVGGNTYISGNGLNANDKVISNVAAGKDGKDAVNVSQLTPLAKALGTQVDPTTGTISAPTFVVTKADGSKYDGSDTIQGALDNIGTEIQKPITFAGNSGNTAKKLGETLTIQGSLAGSATASDRNIRTKVDNGVMTIELAESPKFGDVTINDNGKITGVADGEAPTDAVNKRQLDAAAAAARNKVAAGNNIEVTENQNADGSTTYTVATAKNVGFDSVKAGQGANQVTLDDAGVSIGGNTYISDAGLNANNKKVSNVADGNIASGSKDAVNGGQLHNTATSIANVFGGNAQVNPDGSINMSNVGGTGANNVNDAIQAVNQAAVQAKTTVTAGDNIVVTQNKNADGSNNYTVATAKDLKVDSVVAGDTTLNGKGLTIANGPSITSDGVDAGGKKLTNVAAGEVSANSKDAINGSQLHQVYQLLGGNGSNINTIDAPSNTDASGNTTPAGTVVTVVTNPDGSKTTTTETDQKIAVATDKGGNQYTLTTYNVEGQNTYVTNDVIQAIGKMNEQGIKFFHTNDGNVKPVVQGHNTQDSSASGAYATAIGYQSSASGNGAVAMGNTYTTTDASGNTVAQRTQASGQNSIAIGSGAQALETNTIAIGTGNVVSGKNSGAIGDPNTISGSDSYALGNDNTVSTNNTFVVGNNVTQTLANSVILGNQSAAIAVHTTAGGGNYTYAGANDANVSGVNDVVGVVSVGAEGKTRQVQNVAAGVVAPTSTDAINGSQLYYTNEAINKIGNYTANLGNQLNQKIDDVGQRANAGTASAMAMAGLPQAYLPGKSMMAVSGSTYRGESGYAIGYSSISDNGNWIIKGTAGGNSRGHFGATAGVGYQW